MKKRIVDGLLGLIVGIILILFLTPKHENIDDILKEKDKQYARKIDSLNRTIKDLETKDKLLLNTIKLLRSDKAKIIREKEYYKVQYEILKKKPVSISNFNDNQVDSLLSTIYHR